MNTLNDWQELVLHAQKNCKSLPARKKILELGDAKFWAQSVEEANLLQSKTQEASIVLEKSALWNGLQELEGIETLCMDLERSRILECADIVRIRDWLYVVQNWCDFNWSEFKLFQMKQSASLLLDPYLILRKLDKVLTSDGEISDQASPQLSKLRSEYRSIKTRIDQRLSELTNHYSQLGILQEKTQDYREGHYVLPVKISDQHKCEGNIYGTSASKHTVYIEPREVERLNQELIQKEGEILQVTYEILKEISAFLKPEAQALLQSSEHLIEWDITQAKARCATVYGGRIIEVRKDRAFDLGFGAHPLLWKTHTSSEIIRNDFECDEKIKVLLISGPNAGGKTVFLKSLGVAAIFARTGFFYPGGARPIGVPFYENIFLDLGDLQDIHQHLSSFTGRIKSISQILERVNESSLVLLDELNSATDPTEGSALSRALLEAFMEKNCTVIATTHDPYLKALGVNHPEIKNAAMEFNENSQQPLFKLHIGIPGRSRALEVAENSGLSKKIIERARAYLTHQHIQFETVIADLENQEKEVLEKNRQLQKTLDELNQQKEAFEKRALQASEDLIARTRKKMKELVFTIEQDVKTRLSQMIRTRKTHELEIEKKELLTEVDKVQNEIFSSLIEEVPQAQELVVAKKASVDPDKLSVRDWVKVPQMKSFGKISNLNKNKVEVVLGDPVTGKMTQIKLNLSNKDIQIISEYEKEEIYKKNKKKSGLGSTPVVNVQVQGLHSGSQVESQLDLRGVRFEEAMLMLEGYLDRAFRSRRAEVIIVHGLGTGAIREGTRRYLEKLSFVKSFQDGGVGRGGTGSTVVYFDYI